MNGPGARYRAMFARLDAAGEGAFVPFTVLGDPVPEVSLAVVRALAEAGADALELGLPFSDPIADGPVLQAAATRALQAGVRRADCWAIVRALRGEHPDMPIGLLVYANLVCHRDPALFYGEARDAGVDSVLVADLPLAEAGPLAACAREHGIAPVFIAPPNADAARLAAIAAAGAGYTYVTSREGVTGADRELSRSQGAVLEHLRRLGAPPPLLGFGIATPAHVRAALALGAAGAISGSAVVRRIADHLDHPSDIAPAVGRFAAEMKHATRRPN